MINHSTTSGLVVWFFFNVFFYAYIRCISWRMGHLRAIFSIQCFVMQEIICKGLHSGQVGDIDLHEMWSGKTKATPTQTSLLGEKQQLNHSLNPQPVCLSVKMHWDMPTELVSEKTVPGRRSAVYHVHMSGTETWNTMKALWFDNDINIPCSKNTKQTSPVMESDNVQEWLSSIWQ